MSGALVGPDTRLTFRPLAVMPDGDDEFLVGDPQSGNFVALPQVGVQLLAELQRGLTVSESAERLAEAGVAVDAADFAAAMVAVGLAEVSAAPAEATAALTVPPPAGTERPAPPRGQAPGYFARPLFSRPAWVLYALALAYSAVVLALRPGYWPAASDLFFHASPGVSLAVVLSIGWCSAAVHELFHGLAGQSAGVPVRYSLSRRLFIPVLQTDLSGLWGLPRQQRYGPFLAGMAWDGLTLAAALSLRLVSDAQVVALPWPRLPAAIALLAGANLAWQCLIFLRTDLYAVMVTALGCRNLYRITYLHLKAKLGALPAGEAAELAGAAPRDLAAARWFGWLYAAGLLWALYFLVAYFLPGLWFAGRWATVTLATATVRQADFWLALTVGLLTLIQVVWPLVLLIRPRLLRSAV